MSDLHLKYYVLNYNSNAKRVEYFNVFNNSRVNNECIKEVKKYLKSSKKYSCVINKYTDYKQTIYGFDALVKVVDSIIKCEEWCRYEYELSVSEPFVKEDSEHQKIDCYHQCKPNMDMITREIIYQYKEYRKEQNRENNKKQLCKR